MEETAECQFVRRTKSSLWTEPAKTAHHSREEPLEVVNVLMLLALRLRDFFQAENVKLVKHTQEPFTKVGHALQTSVLKERRFFQTELAKLAQLTAELPATTKAVLLKFVLPDRFFRLMADVLNATSTLEQMLKESSAFLTTVMIDKNLDQMDHASTALTSREPKELVLLADPTLATSDRECKEMVLASTVSCSTLFAATRNAAQSQLASQWLNISQRMVFAHHVSSTSKPDQMVQPV